MHQLAVDKIAVAGGARRDFALVVQRVAVVRVQPRLAVVAALLLKGQRDGVGVGVALGPAKMHHVGRHVAKVRLELLGRAGAEPLVVLNVPRGVGGRCALPRVVLVERVKEQGGLALFAGFDQRRLERVDKVGQAQQTGPVKVEKVDQQALDVAPIDIGVGHDQDAAIAQVFRVSVLHVLLQPQNLFQLLNLLVAHQLRRRRLAHVQQLALERKDAVVVAPDHRQAAHDTGLGRVALGQNERAFVRLGAARLVRVVQLGNVGQRKTFFPVALFEAVLFFKCGQTDRLVHHAGLGHLFDKIVAQVALAPKVFGRRHELLFGLARKGRVLHQTPHKDP